MNTCFLFIGSIAILGLLFFCVIVVQRYHDLRERTAHLYSSLRQSYELKSVFTHGQATAIKSLKGI